MKAFNREGRDLPAWIWIAVAVSAVLIAFGLLYSAPTSDRGKIGTAPVMSVDPPAQAAPPAAVASPRILRFGHTPSLSGVETPLVTVAEVTANKLVPKRRPLPPAVKRVIAAAPVTPRSMFPVGAIRRAPAVYSPYSQSSEGFPSFSYDHKMWSFVERFAWTGEVDLVPIGYNLGGRTVYAIANTEGPGDVLFVQSRLDPGKVAVYRSS